MSTSNTLTSACRFCRYYQLEGRRGGHCQMLNAPVKGTWKACSLGFPPFAPSWEHLEQLMTLESAEAQMHESLDPTPIEAIETVPVCQAPQPSKRVSITQKVLI
jgi:hypothetical protein